MAQLQLEEYLYLSKAMPAQQFAYRRFYIVLAHDRGLSLCYFNNLARVIVSGHGPIARNYDLQKYNLKYKNT